MTDCLAIGDGKLIICQKKSFGSSYKNNKSNHCFVNCQLVDSFVSLFRVIQEFFPKTIIGSNYRVWSEKKIPSTNSDYILSFRSWQNDGTISKQLKKIFSEPTDVKIVLFNNLVFQSPIFFTCYSDVLIFYITFQV